MVIFNIFSRWKNMKKLRAKEPSWVHNVMWGLFIVWLFFTILVLFVYPVRSIISLFIGFVCANATLNMCGKRKGYPTSALIFGFCGNLVGLALYWFWGTLEKK